MLVGGQDCRGTNCERAKKHEWRCAAQGWNMHARSGGRVSRKEWRKWLPLARGHQIGSDGSRSGTIVWTVCKTIENELFAVSMHVVDDMHHKYDGANDSQESDQAEEGLMRVDLSCDSRSMEIQENAQDQTSLVSPDTPVPPSQDCDSFRQRLLLAPAPPFGLLELEEKKD